jgi:hypothetical protein
MSAYILSCHRGYAEPDSQSIPQAPVGRLTSASLNESQTNKTCYKPLLLTGRGLVIGRGPDAQDASLVLWASILLLDFLESKFSSSVRLDRP